MYCIGNQSPVERALIGLRVYVKPYTIAQEENAWLNHDGGFGIYEGENIVRKDDGTAIICISRVYLQIQDMIEYKKRMCNLYAII